jgi:hypothetical protein
MSTVEPFLPNSYRRQVARKGWLAARLAKQGFPVFRLKVNGKTPAFTGWQSEATVDPARVVELWGKQDFNIGIATGRGQFVVDLDEKNGKHGIANFAGLGDCPPTLMNTTPSGGRHVIFTGGDGLRNTVGALATGIDTRGAGGLFVAPGSTVDGKAYRWHASVRPDMTMAPLPEWLRELCARPVKEPR